MPSVDFQHEKRAFSRFYDEFYDHMVEVKDAYIEALSELISRSDVGEVTKIDGRIKAKGECISKFKRKYQSKLEAEDNNYEIKDFISDLIGIRIVCLYEDQIPVVAKVLKRHFKIIDVTDKIAAIDQTEDSFGYRCLHMDVAPSKALADLPSDYPVEIQVRSVIQDAWSQLDHKIKYKKSIPTELKRRINVLSALFELADREFREIRDATLELMQQETEEAFGDQLEIMEEGAEENAAPKPGKRVNAFNFMGIAQHFFNDFAFDDFKVDHFVQDILKRDRDFPKSALHTCLVDHLKTVREYQEEFIGENPENTFSPYTAIRHCLYRSNPETFQRILPKVPRLRFEAWLKQNS